MCEPIIKTEYGEVQGVSEHGCIVYKGIPFAKPPVGDLAFRHPVSPEPWDGVFHADSGSANPIQDQGGFSVPNNSQDCLYLNIFVPEENGKKEVQKGRPVMVWIYGGSYNRGGSGAKSAGSADLIFNMSRFAKDTGTIVVTFNYRLNLYGFLNLHFLSERFDPNCGLYDQIFALKFVRNNIAAFGGDPENITLFGQSAGAACILALMSMPDAEGLFQKGIIQSACVDHFFTEEESRRNTKSYLKRLNIPESEPEHLLDLSAEIVTAQNKAYSAALRRSGDVRCAFSPVIDGKTLPEPPSKAVLTRTLPILMGTVLQEGNLFVNPIPAIALPFTSLLMHIKPRKGTGSYRQRISDGLSDFVYNIPMKELLANYPGKAWCYSYQHIRPAHKENGMGCFHACEIPVLFGIMNDADEGSEATGVFMRKIWGTFAHTSDPGFEPYLPDHSIHVIS